MVHIVRGDMKDMNFADKIRRLRHDLGWTQERLAKEIGITTRSIVKYEKGQTYPRDRDVYGRLAAIFGVETGYLMSEDDEFVAEVTEKYGVKGRIQAQALIDAAEALFAGGELSDDDKLAFVHEIQGLYLDSKERAKRFRPKGGRAG